jgi:hypothetical protein
MIDGQDMSKVSDALDALRLALDHLDDLEEWAAAGHVSMAISLLYATPEADDPGSNAPRSDAHRAPLRLNSKAQGWIRE